MNARSFHRVAILAVLVGLASSCGKRAGSDMGLTGPAYVLTTEGSKADVDDVLLKILQGHMKPVRVTLSSDEPVKLGTIHFDMRVFETKFEKSGGRKEKASIPRHINATVTVVSYDGSCNWDGEHSIGFETDPPVSFSDAAKTRRRYAKRLLEVAVKQLPGRGAFKHDTLSAAQPPK